MIEAIGATCQSEMARFDVYKIDNDTPHSSSHFADKTRHELKLRRAQRT